MRLDRTSASLLATCLALLAACGGPNPPAAPGAAPSPSPSGSAQAPEPVPPLVDLGAAGDEFNDPATLPGWTVLQGDLISGEPHRYDIGTSAPGTLNVDVAQSTWVREKRGFYLCRQVRGDFAVTVRVKPSGRATPLPTVDWSLTGLLLRAPKDPAAAENWIGYTAGFVSDPVIETKTTINSQSYLNLTRVEGGWIELRAVRVQHLFVLLHRQGTQPWTLDAVYPRTDLPPALLVGIDALTGGEGDRADLRVEADWIRFAPHGIPADVQQRVLAQAPTTTSRQDRYALPPAAAATVRDAWWPYLAA